MSEIYHVTNIDSNRYTTWTDVFQSLNRNAVYVMCEPPTKALQDDATRVFLLWRLSLHWVIKLKWKSNYRIPYCPKIAKVIEPFGTLLFHYLELCIQCHGFLTPDNPYPTAANWFWAIANESRNDTIFNRIGAAGKTQSLAIKREIVNAIHLGINPLCQETHPHQWRLIETARRFNKGDNFDKEYLRPFIRAYRHWINATKSDDWLAVVKENDKLYTRTGQGKGKVLLSFDNLKL